MMRPLKQAKIFTQKLCKQKVSARVLAVLILVTTGCRKMFSSEPPIHWNPNMDNQTVFKPQSENAHFADKRSERPLQPGTVANGKLKQDPAYYDGKVNDAFIKELPANVKLTEKLLTHGQERYKMYCTPCHGGGGNGNGIVKKRGYDSIVANFHDAKYANIPVGQIYSAIKNGVNNGNMPPYNERIPDVSDRWAISAYVKALQKTKRAHLADVPKETATMKGWSR